jgi:hypothetical protein
VYLFSRVLYDTVNFTPVPGGSPYSSIHMYCSTTGSTILLVVTVLVLLYFEHLLTILEDWIDSVLEYLY